MIFDRLRVLLAELFDEELQNITMETDFEEDLYADSLDIVELLMIIEEEFGFKDLEEMDLSQYHTVGDVVKFIERGGVC